MESVCEESEMEEEEEVESVCEESEVEVEEEVESL